MAKAKKEKVNESMEQVLWNTANKLRKNMDAAEYKHIVSGLIFLKYISDSFTELQSQMEEANLLDERIKANLLKVGGNINA